MADPNDSELPEGEEEESTESTETESTETGEENEGDPKPDPKAEKRIKDLQSKADAAEARANKAEKALAALGKGDKAGSNDPAQAALMQELREASLDAVYGEFADLKKYSIDRSLIEGSTRAEMRESATAIVGLVKAIATKVRNETLAENGIKAEPAGAARKPPVDYGSMSDQDFEKLLNSIS